MSAKPIHEATSKCLIYKEIEIDSNILETIPNFVFCSGVDWIENLSKQSWISQYTKFVAKPDQLIKRRGKLGLVKCGTLPEIHEWIKNLMSKPFKIGETVGNLNRFIIEPFIQHSDVDECYVCIYSERNNDKILFHHAGGVNIGDIDKIAKVLVVEIDKCCSIEEVESNLLTEVNDVPNKKLISKFICSLYQLYVKMHFTYLEINPLVIKEGKIFILDVAAKLDQCAEFLVHNLWGKIIFPPPFGRGLLPEEQAVADLDSRSGASLKLTILNKSGRIWTLVAGGGASVVYADTVCDLGGASELANYGEYSGAPTEQQTFEYAKIVLSLMFSSPVHSSGKILLIGGGIANFTNVAATFKGIIAALRFYQKELHSHAVKIYVRRAGPNYQEGLRMMRELGQNLGVEIYVFGPETHMTAIVGMALGKTQIPENPTQTYTTANFLLPSNSSISNAKKESVSIPEKTNTESISKSPEEKVSKSLFDENTKCIVWGMQNRAVQNMLDFDFVCSRKSPSVAAIVYPFVDNHKMHFYWGQKEIPIPVYKELSEGLISHPEASVLVNFASLRSAYDTSLEVVNGWSNQIKCIAIIAEGIPENLTRRLNHQARINGVTIIGPATVGGIKPGCLKIGNTAGMMDNILQSSLYYSGSVAYVSRSGGMSNELNNIISLNADSVYEGIAIGGDRYPGTTFIDHILRYQADPNVKLIVMLGEVGGNEEYHVIDAIKSGKITKPIVAWCIGTCSGYFTSEVQFGHAGSCAQAEMETALEKNKALKAVGVTVPSSFDSLGKSISDVFQKLVKSNQIKLKERPTPPTVPMDYSWARELGLIRKPASFLTSITDERGQELLYGGIPITEIINQDFGIGGVLSLLWFQKRLPEYAAKFIEMCLIVTADHGPAVSGAHNTIVCARAGKDVVSCLASGLLTIGDRFGGAIDGAAKQFSKASDSGQEPIDFVNSMRKKGELIMGIGHRVKSINNPDKRVEILKEYVHKYFRSCPLLSYALEVEKITTTKKPNLILNVDGFIGVSMVDMMRTCEIFTLDEVNENIENGCLNALFVLGRSMGFIGHFLDQRRLKQGLYRHPWDDISYILPEQNL